MKRALTISAFILSACFATKAQQADSLLTDKTKISLDSLNDFFTHEDSLGIFDLIDSLLRLEPAKETSQMAVRLGYNSNIVADNSTFNIGQFGLAPGLSYYHKSGLFADFTSYWSKEYEPNFYLSVASAGYLHSITKWYSIIGEYSHYFYSQDDAEISVPYTNNLGLTNYFEFKPLVVRLDYYFYFGQKTAHRIMPSVGINLVKKNWLGFNRISFYPNFNVLFGSEETITGYEFYPNLLLRLLYNRNNPTTKIPIYKEKTAVLFGVMNYSFSAPVSFTLKNWTILVSYNYNLPQSLQNEDTSLQPGGYLSFSITRYISF